MEIVCKLFVCFFKFVYDKLCLDIYLLKGIFVRVVLEFFKFFLKILFRLYGWVIKFLLFIGIIFIYILVGIVND